ncbi:MAG: Rpn family recombination-promoting nuclease/putative transposase [Lachnospiraceae bacterium]
MGAKDITEKQLADYNDVFADIINGVLFDGEQIVSENELQNVKDKSQYKFNNKIHEQERDISKRWIPHKICFALYGLEHQTDAEPYAPIRIIGYDGASYRGQLTKRERSKPKYPVITIVLYFGTKHWNQPKSLYECMDIPKRLKPFVNDYKINLVEVAFLDSQLDKFHSDFRIIAEYFINKRQNIDYMPSAQEIKHVDEFLKLMQALERDDRYENVLYELQREGKKEGVKMSEVLDRIENRGIAIGEKRGISIGEKRGISIGERRGREKMANAINTLNSILLEQNRIEDLKRAVADWEYQQLLLAEYGLDDEDEQPAQE